VILQCAECGYQLLAEQTRCPECGSDASPLTVITAGRNEDLAWHRGWTSIGCGFVLFVGVALAGLRTMIGGTSSAIPCGLPLLLLAGLALFGFAGELKRRLSRGETRPDRAAFDDDYLYDDIDGYALAAIEQARVEKTLRPDRWHLVVTLRPLAATLTIDEIERREERDDALELSLAGGTAVMYLAADEGEARAFADALESRVRAARSDRIDMDDELARELLDPSGTGVPVVQGADGRDVLRVGTDALVVTGRRRRVIPWTRVKDLGLDGYRFEDARGGGVRRWRWVLAIGQAPYFDAGLRIDRRAVAVRFAHDDPRAGAALWWVLTQMRPDV